MLPEGGEILAGEGGDLSSDEEEERGEEEVHSVRDEVMVTELDVLELHGFFEIREVPIRW